MSTIIKPDPYLEHYIYEKTTNPEARLVWKTYQRRLVDKVDALVELARGYRETVSSDNDWKVVEEIMKFFASEWPNEFNEFANSISDIRSSRKSGGYSESKEIKYVGAISPRLMKLVKAIFPVQQWDKKFVNKFVKRFPLFKIGGEGN